MLNDYTEEEIIVHPIHGMQLSEGYIRTDNSKGFRGCLPGLMPYVGKTIEEVRARLEQRAQAYYGDDVIVEIASQAIAN
ncbi:MAG: hypothetical protein K9M54_06655 [Kiritimatiellales bacterium]|nr:hypothetical protein [Kiritimatiellales bacterium]MCF7863446.1 hypothetical protein [Kiritimatiellales bacterium]